MDGNVLLTRRRRRIGELLRFWGDRPIIRKRRQLVSALAIVAMVPATAAIAGAEEEVANVTPMHEARLDLSSANMDGVFSDATEDGFDAAPQFVSPIETDLGNGVASYYGRRFAGRPTANGEIFDPTELTAAHRTLPFGSRVRVTSGRTGESVIVRINDRGPFHGNRVIDLSRAAAEQIGMIARGKDTVSLTLLDG